VVVPMLAHSKNQERRMSVLFLKFVSFYSCLWLSCFLFHWQLGGGGGGGGGGGEGNRGF